MITLLQLEYFRKLAETEHITRTAKQLFISQTALSRMIIGLEKELGVQLFDRSARTIRLNAAGKLYLEYVNSALTTLELGRTALMDSMETAEKEISVAVGTSLVWAPMLHSFQKKFPQHVVRQMNMTLDGLESALQTMSVDFVIASIDDIRTTGLSHDYIKTDYVYVCVPENHALALRESVYLEELKSEPFISLPKGTPWRVYCDRLFKSAGFSVKPVVECDYTMRAALVSSGFGIALTTSSAREVDLLGPNKYVRIADEFAQREMVLFWNSKRYMSKAAQSFRQFCLEYYRTDSLADTPITEV